MGERETPVGGRNVSNEGRGRGPPCRRQWARKHDEHEAEKEGERRYKKKTKKEN